VVNHAANINSPDSAHDGILPHRSRRKKVPDTFSLNLTIEANRFKSMCLDGVVIEIDQRAPGLCPDD
jgi:hypothetical protein